MANPDDISLEFVRRTLAGHSPAQLRTWVVNALDGRDVDESSGWQIRTAADALREHEPVEYLVDQLLSAPSLSIVYGGPGSLKSMILADLAICVASGSRWLDQLGSDGAQPGVSLAVKQAPVLWIDFDNGARRTDIRIGAMLRGRNLPDSTPIHYVSMPVPHLDVSRPDHVERLGALISGAGYRLIIIDNLGLVTGNVEENSAAMANVMGNLRRLAEETGAAIVLIHHQRKSAINGDSSGVRKGESLRGHSSIEAALDLALLVERKPGTDEIAVIVTKMRDYMPFSIFGAQFTYEHVAGNRDLHSARFFSVATATKEEAAAQTLRNAILDAVRSAPGIGQKQLVDDVRDTLAASEGRAPGVNKVRGTLKNMVEDGTVRTSGSNGGTDGGGFKYWPSR